MRPYTTFKREKVQVPHLGTFSEIRRRKFPEKCIAKFSIRKRKTLPKKKVFAKLVLIIAFLFWECEMRESTLSSSDYCGTSAFPTWNEKKLGIFFQPKEQILCEKPSIGCVASSPFFLSIALFDLGSSSGDTERWDRAGLRLTRDASQGTPGKSILRSSSTGNRWEPSIRLSYPLSPRFELINQHIGKLKKILATSLFALSSSSKGAPWGIGGRSVLPLPWC